MYIFELTQPGGRLKGIEDGEMCRDQEALLDLLIVCVQDAAISLSWFEAIAAPSRDEIFAEQDERRAMVRRITDAMLAQLPNDLSQAEFGRALRDVVDMADIQAKRELWRTGKEPSSYRGRAPFIHAKSCLYALDTLQKTLELLTKFPDAPEIIDNLLAEFATTFPDLRHVRDSSHHTEDRVQGKRRASRIDLSGPLVVDFLDGNRYRGTLADGTIGEVEISSSSVAAAHRIVQVVLDSYQWSGPPHHFPH